MKTTSWLLALPIGLLGCQATETPSNTPPPSWGVPITGGTMLITKDGLHAVVADPDRGRIVDVDLVTEAVVGELALKATDEPARMVEDNAGRIHIALRRAGTVITMPDAASGQLAYSRAVCPEPRGIAYDGTADVIHVACTGGELVTLPAANAPATRTLHLDRDLRDVIVNGSQLTVTRFKSSEILTLDATGAIVNRVSPPTVQRFDESGGFANGPAGGVPDGSGTVNAIPTVAWRTIAMPNGGILMSHQRQVQTVLDEMQGGYGRGCGGPIESAVTIVPPGGQPFAVAPPISGTLPVDVAINRNGDSLAFVLAGAKSVQVVPISALAIADMDGCGNGGGSGSGGDGGMGSGGGDGGSGSGGVPTPITQTPPNPNPAPSGLDDELGAPTSVAYKPNGELLVFYPEYPAVVVHALDNSRRMIILSGDIGYDSGRALFHTQTGIGLACASCHPEGRDDGLVWNFADVGLRRTQVLAGHILGRAPYHWAGDLVDIPTLMNTVFTVRMDGGDVTHSQQVSLGPWLERVPAPVASPATDTASVARGQAIFESTAQACTTCHNGALMTNKSLVNVGTGNLFKVPSLLGVGARPPYMHDGCAPTLADRFDPTLAACNGGEAHGHTAALTSAQVTDLISYLDTL